MKTTRTSKETRRRAFWRGFSSVFDFSFSPRVIRSPGPRPLDPDEAMRQDAENIRRDWERVGRDIFKVAKLEVR